MIKNIIFDIGNVILNFDILKVLSIFTNDQNERDFILSRLSDITINVRDLTDTKLIKMIGKAILDYYKR